MYTYQCMQRCEPADVCRFAAPAMGTALDWVKAVAGVKYSFNPIVGLYRPPGSDEPVTPSEIVPTGLAIWAAIIEAGYLVLP